MAILSQAREVSAEIGRILGRQVIATYLYGSAVEGGLRPDSDLDILVLTTTSLDEATRGEVIGAALALSGGSGKRPLELTVVALEDVVPWRYPPRLEMQYGEWLRAEALAGDPLGPVTSADLAVLLTQVRGRSFPLSGPAADTVFDPVPTGDLRRAMVDSLPSLLPDLGGDERNVILTLARMWITTETGEIVPKDVAADRLLVRGTRSSSRRVLELARDAYRGDVVDDWAELAGEISEFVKEARAVVAKHSSGAG
jgi:streptomycin 3"-adenylyltransferase